MVMMSYMLALFTWEALRNKNFKSFLTRAVTGSLLNQPTAITVRAICSIAANQLHLERSKKTYSRKLSLNMERQYLKALKHMKKCV